MMAVVRWLALAAGLVILSHAASAQTAADTMARWGMLGTWALDCSKPPSRQNGYLSYVRKPGGAVSHEREFGDSRDAHDISQATIGPHGTLELVVHFKSFNQVRKWRLMKGADGRIRAIVNSSVKNDDYTIKDGKFTGNGADVPWQTRCR